MTEAYKKQSSNWSFMKSFFFVSIVYRSIGQWCYFEQTFSFLFQSNSCSCMLLFTQPSRQARSEMSRSERRSEDSLFKGATSRFVHLEIM